MQPLFAISIDAREFERFGRVVEKSLRRQIPFAAARALTDAVKIAQRDFKQKLPSIFNRPTPFTLNATYVRPARKDDLQASIEIKNFAGKGTPASKYLRSEIVGGRRGLKPFERRLDFAGHTGGMALVPASGAKLDQYGNVSRGQIVQILSRLRAMSDVQSNVSAKTTRRLRRQGLLVRHRGVGVSDYFIAHSKIDGRALGIYQLVSKGHVKPVFIFARTRPSYAPRLDFVPLMRRSFERNFPRLMGERLRQALETAH